MKTGSDCVLRRLRVFVPVIVAVFFLTAPLLAKDDFYFDYLRRSLVINSFHNAAFEEPVGVFVDRENDEVFVADSGRAEVFLFRTDGTPIHRFGKMSGITNPTDVVVRNDLIYISQEGNPYIDVLSFTGTPLKHLAPLKVPFYPGKMDVDGEGNLYVVNNAARNCVVFDSEDAYTGSIGEGFNTISAVAVSDDRVYILTPLDNRAVRVYNKAGEFIMAYEGIEGAGGRFGMPVSAKVDSEGRLWIVDALRGVFVYDRDGVRVGGFGWQGPPAEWLSFPVEIDFDRKNRVYLIEQGKKRLSVFQ